MRIKLPAPPQAGDTRTSNHFAFIPRRVDNTLIWFEWYKKHWQYHYNSKHGYGYWLLTSCSID